MISALHWIRILNKIVNHNLRPGEISKGKNLDINLEKYATGMCSFYNTLACIKLAMNYYTVYDMYNEHPVKNLFLMNVSKSLTALLQKIAAKEDIDIKTVDDLRNKVTGKCNFFC